MRWPRIRRREVRSVREARAELSTLIREAEREADSIMATIASTTSKGSHQ